MTGNAILMLIFTGLYFIPPPVRSTQQNNSYILVDQRVTFAEARKICRQNYTDLATVRNQQESDDLNEVVARRLNIWIGLQADPKIWTWSLENRRGENDNGFRSWYGGHPNGNTSSKYCTAVLTTGEWIDEDCTEEHEFICYNENEDEEQQESSSNFIFISQKKNWMEAQRYCRHNYTDLASVRNTDENDQIARLRNNKHGKSWIGLSSSTWRWLDGSPYSFKNWAENKPTSDYDRCGVSNFYKWFDRDCSDQNVFACSNVTRKRRQVVQVVLKKTDSSVDMEDLNILEGFSQKLKDHGMSEDIKLKWVKRPDGKIFHKKEKREQGRSYGSDPHECRIHF